MAGHANTLLDFNTSACVRAAVASLNPSLQFQNGRVWIGSIATSQIFPALTCWLIVWNRSKHGVIIGQSLILGTEVVVIWLVDSLYDTNLLWLPTACAHCQIVKSLLNSVLDCQELQIISSHYHWWKLICEHTKYCLTCRQSQRI